MSGSIRSYPESRPTLFLYAWIVCAAGIGCATSTSTTSTTSTDMPSRSFDFSRDVFTYTNDNYWSYDFESDPGRTIVTRRPEEVDHGQRCTIMARVARQFFYSARFDPSGAKLSRADYRELIRSVLASSPRAERPTDTPVVFPGYADLRSFSVEFESLLKAELGGRWIGYFQRGNWRMIFPFLPRQNRATADELVADLERGHLPLVHVVNYPRIDVNHTVLLFAYTRTPTEIAFELYDPNDAGEPGSLVLDRATAVFHYNRTDYFVGGPAEVYEIYDGPLY
jgi:hypothetical protein